MRGRAILAILSVATLAGCGVTPTAQVAVSPSRPTATVIASPFATASPSATTGPAVSPPTPSVEPSPESPVPAITVDHPIVEVTPAHDLQDRQIIDVEVRGFGVGGKVWLSECASAADATSVGCGAELAAQTFIVTDEDGVGSTQFEVRAKAATSSVDAPPVQCAGDCVIVATLGADLPYVSAPIGFGGPSIEFAGTFRGRGVWAATLTHVSISGDGGRTWSNSRLPRYITVDVFDRKHVWLVSATSGSVWPYGDQGYLDTLHLVVRRSTDGGRRWRSVTIPGNFGGTTPVLAFTSARNGYLLSASLRGGPPSTVLRTQDGGRTWRIVRIVDFHLGSVFSASSATVLWSGTQGDAGPVERPVLDVSRDGGRTWRDTRLPGLIGSIYATNTVLAPPAFFGRIGIVAVESEPITGQAVTIYRSVDGGATWRRASNLLDPTGGQAFVARDATHWLFASSTGLRRTADGGRTWSRFAPKGLPPGPATLLQFSDPEHGVAFVSVAGYDAPGDLYLTADGGETWTAVRTK